MMGMMIDYAESLRERLDGDFFRVKKAFDVDFGRGCIEQGTVVGLCVKEIKRAYDGERYCRLAIYPSFEKDCSVSTSKSVIADFPVFGEDDEWFDEWFTLATEVNEVRWEYDSIRERLSDIEEKICLGIFLFIFITGIVLVAHFAVITANLRKLLQISAIILVAGIFSTVFSCIAVFMISDCVSRRHLEELEQEFASLVE